jgi:hypothetical protein
LRAISTAGHLQDGRGSDQPPGILPDLLAD